VSIRGFVFIRRGSIPFTCFSSFNFSNGIAVFSRYAKVPTGIDIEISEVCELTSSLPTFKALDEPDNTSPVCVMA
jgi:hypothetical protein